MPGTGDAHKVYDLFGAAGRSALPSPVALCVVPMPLLTKVCAADPATSITLSHEGATQYTGGGGGRPGAAKP